MKKHWPFLLIITVSVIIRLPTFLMDFVNIDENEYAIAAEKMLAGGFPYKDFLIYQPPVIFFVYALAFLISGGTNIWAAHIISILFVAGTITALYSLAAGVSGSKRAGLAAALAYGIFSTTFIPHDMLAANCEIIMAFPLTLSVLMLFYADRRHSCASLSFLRKQESPVNAATADSSRNPDRINEFPAFAGTTSWIYFLLAGLFAAVGLLTKYQGGVLIVIEFFYVIIVSAVIKKHFTISANIIPATLLLIGAMIPFIAVVLYLHSGGALAHAMEALNYIFRYAKGPPQSDPLYVAMKFTARTILFMISGAVMWIGAFGIVRRYILSGRRCLSLDNKQFILFAILWFFISFIPIIVGGRIYFHYYLILLPPASLLFGIWWAARGQYTSRLFKTAALVWTIICVIGWTAFAISRPLRKPGPKEAWIYAIDFLRIDSSKGDTLFVWGYCPQMYIISGLKPATRFTTADYLTGRSPMTAGLEYDPNAPNPPSSWRKFLNDFIDPPGVVNFDTSRNIFPKAWQYLKEDFNRGLPTYIVDTSPSNYRRYGRYPISKFPYLDKIIKKNYVLIKSIKGFDVYKIQSLSKASST